MLPQNIYTPCDTQAAIAAGRQQNSTASPAFDAVTEPQKLTPDREAILAHLQAWAEPFIGTEYDDGLVEIAFTAPGVSAVDRARLFELDNLEAAADFATAQNVAGSNIYIGVALRAPDADRRRRAGSLDFYAAAFVAAEADRGAKALADRINALGLKGTIRVRTGTRPETRVHHWLRLRELCDDAEDHGAATAALVAHIGADMKVKDSARVLRLGGTVNWILDPRKRAEGYVDEACALIVQTAPAADLVRLTALEPTQQPDASPRTAGAGGNGGAGEITRNDEGKVTDGREAFWRHIVLHELAEAQRRQGADPTAEDLFDAAFERFAAETEGDDRWTSQRGKRDLMKRVENTLRRLRHGHLVRFGLASIETGVGAEEAKRVQQGRDARYSGDLQFGTAAAQPPEPPQIDFAADPIDLWGHFEPPALTPGLLPGVIEDFANVQGEQMGADPAGLAMAALVTCAAALHDEIKVQVKRHDPHWCESARIWAALVGSPSTKKTPILSAATAPLCRLDVKMFRQWQADMVAFAALSKEDRQGREPPPQRRLRIEDATVEAAQQVLEGSPWGVLLLQDELSGFFGQMDKYAGGKAASADRAFWLRSFNGGEYALNRVSRGAAMIPNLSVSLLGGIQPEAIRKVANDAQDDGLLQRLFPIVLKPATVGRDEPAPPVVDTYARTVEALRHMRSSKLGPVHFSDEAQAIRRDLEAWHLKLTGMEHINRKLASHVGKYDGLFARLCLLWHCIEGTGIEPREHIDEGTAQRVAEFMRTFLLPHAVAFYGGTLRLSDDHDRLQAIAGYILTHKLERVTNRDVQRGDRTMRKIADADIRPLLEQLAALGWLERLEPLRPSSPPRWQVNPAVHVLFADRAEQEAKRRKAAQEAIAGALPR